METKPAIIAKNNTEGMLREPRKNNKTIGKVIIGKIIKSEPPTQRRY